MSIKVGNSWVSESVYAQVKTKNEKEQGASSNSLPKADSTDVKKDMVEISDEAKLLYMQGEFGKLKPWQGEPSFQKPEKGTIQPSIKNELPVQEIFREGTAEHFIFNSLDGKVENAYELARQLGDMIFSHDNEKDVEARAIDRETGKKLAEYIAKNYLDDPSEAQSFLDGINKITEKSEMRDKGYIVLIGSDIEPFKPKYNDLQRFVEEKFGYTNVDWSDTETSSKIISAFLSEAMKLALAETKKGQYYEVGLPSKPNYDSTPFMYKKEKEEFNKSFDENENTVQAIIDKVKTAIGSTFVDDDFFSNMYKIPK